MILWSMRSPRPQFRSRISWGNHMRSWEHCLTTAKRREPASRFHDGCLFKCGIVNFQEQTSQFKSCKASWCVFFIIFHSPLLGSVWFNSGRWKSPFAGLSTADRHLGHCRIVSSQLATVDPSGFLAGKPEGEGLSRSEKKKVQSLETGSTSTGWESWTYTKHLFALGSGLCGYRSTERKVCWPRPLWPHYREDEACNCPGRYTGTFFEHRVSLSELVWYLVEFSG